MSRFSSSLFALTVLVPLSAQAQTNPLAPTPYYAPMVPSFRASNPPALMAGANTGSGGVEPESLRGVANAVTHASGLASHMLWVDSTANIDTTATREGIAALVARAKAAHFNTLVVDVKPLSGEVIYNSKIAPHLSEWKGKKYDPNFDRLTIFVEEGKKSGLSVFAAMNTFSEGHKMFNVGPGYNRPDWQSLAYNVARTVQAANGQAMPFPATPDEMAPLGQLSVLSPGAIANILKPEGIWALVDAGGLVSVVGEARSVAELGMPAGSRVLVGRGAAANWVSANIHAGEKVRFTATPVLQKLAQASWEKVGLFVSPHNPEVRAYETNIAHEIAQNYDVKGVVFDRMRYSNLSTDFSDTARADFEAFLGHWVANWPQDVFSYADDPFAPRREGALYKQWLEFRAVTIQSFLRETSDALHAIRPQIQLGVYVGSWYSDYYPVGVNWGADDFNAAYPWMTPEYFRTGYAKPLDWLTTGCYYPLATRAEARALGADPQATVETAAALSNRAVNDVAWVYGGLYVEDYLAKSKNLPGKPGDFVDKPEALARAIAVCKATTQGVMIFDAVHLDQKGWWDVVGKALATDTKAPDAVPGLLEGVRATATALKQSRGNNGVTLAPAVQVPISATP